MEQKQTLQEMIDQLSEEGRRWFNAIHGGPERYHFERILRDAGPEAFDKYLDEHKEEYKYLRNF